ncbi:MAG: threonine/serine exporter family protein [Clostridiales Family XIII bacterium]|jgi:uncharacterized membrane protein YjjP (DUF1212 family)|nr:threonine/serine exporter family protein [Clostridiales Family XIII bacterium]
MKNAYKKRVLVLALFAGEIMLKAGAEIYRVEDTIIRICKACRIDYVECFAMTTGITLSLDTAEDDADMHTFIKRISRTTIDLTKISKINQFSRVFTSTDLSVADGFEQLRAINAEKGYPFLLRLLGAMLVGAFTLQLYGGGGTDTLCGAGVSGVAYVLSEAVGKLRFPAFIRIFISSAACALLLFFLSAIGIAHNVTPLVIASLMIFMPGVSITTAARDLLSGDMLSGIARFAEALIIAVAIAGGGGSMLKLWQSTGGLLTQSPSYEYSVFLFLLFGTLSTIGFCVLFNAPLRQIPVISLIGGAGMLSLASGIQYGLGDLASCFLGTCIVAIFAECASRAGKDATTVFILPGIIPFVPGTMIYQTMDSILSGNYIQAAGEASEALLTAGSIAAALILIASLTRLINAVVRRISEKLAERRERLERAAQEVQDSLDTQDSQNAEDQR